MRIPYYAEYNADLDTVTVYGPPSRFPRADWQAPAPAGWGTEYWMPGPPVVQDPVTGYAASLDANAGVSRLSVHYLRSDTSGTPPMQRGNADSRPYQRLGAPRWRQSLYAYSAGATATRGVVDLQGV